MDKASSTSLKIQEVETFQSTYSHEGYESAAGAFCMERYNRSVPRLNLEISG